MRKLETIPVISTRSECDFLMRSCENFSLSQPPLSLSLCLPGGSTFVYVFFSIKFFLTKLSSRYATACSSPEAKVYKKRIRAGAGDGGIVERKSVEKAEKKETDIERERQREREESEFEYAKYLCNFIYIRVYYDMQTDAD